MKAKGVRIIGIGVTDDVDDDVMLQIVTDPDDYYPVTDFDRLNEIVSSITTQVGRTY